MRTFIFLCTLCFTVPAATQTVDRLDQNNGFRKFKFGISPSQVGHLVDYSTSIKQRGVTYFSYKGNDVTEFNGIRIDGINLGFYKNRLYVIQVSFGSTYKEYTSNEFGIVQSGLEANFGHAYHQCNDDNSSEIINCAIWDSNSVRLESLRLHLSEKDGTQNRMFNYIQGYMLFTDKQIQLEQQRGEIEN